MPCYIQVAVPLPLDNLYTYEVPERLSGEVAIGKRVLVPFHFRSMTGYIVSLGDKSDVSKIKAILRVIDKEPLLTDEMLRLGKWVGENYFCSWGEALHAMTPAGLKSGKSEVGTRIKEIHFDSLKYAKSEHFKLTGEQTLARDEIIASFDKREPRTFLLHGITGSGKTEVYLQAIDHVLKAGKQAIVLVPEIALTPQAIERFVSRFGEDVAVIHSHLTSAKRFLEWKKIKEGKARIVVGARSAIFSPTKDLGLIIIDEEHETSYKQDDVPRYHARDVAIERSRHNKCPIVLGSATPSLESYHKAKTGEYKLIELTKRIDERPMPKVKIVDMRVELAAKHKNVVFSKILSDAVERTIKSGKQAILFLNRRGFSTFVHCKKCGYIVKCKSCDISMVYHFEEKQLICHYCDHKAVPPDICPSCHSSYISYFGLGTEKVESEVSRHFSSAKIARMDSDTTKKAGSHDKILTDFKDGKINLLVGTQMVAKGHDFPEVTLVGVISADVSLNIPDFRSSERTFNLITQVAGRAGRGDEPGEVIVQTYVPDHYSILAASKHDYERFYAEEIVSRKELLYPPFTDLIKITIRARRDDEAMAAAKELRETIERLDHSQLIAGPAPSPISRLRGYFRYNILLKSPERLAQVAFLKKALGEYKKPHGVLIAVDVDPVSM